MKLTPYYAYRIYFTLKKHFSGTHDITAHDWKFLRPKEDSFENTRAYATFRILVNYKIKNVHDWIKMLIVCFVNDRTINFRTILENFEYWQEQSEIWQGRISAMPIIFRSEASTLIGMMFKEGKTFDEFFPVWLLEKFCDRVISVETFIIFKKILKIGLDGLLDYEYLYKEPYERYELLLKFDLDKYRTILGEVITDERAKKGGAL